MRTTITAAATALFLALAAACSGGGNGPMDNPSAQCTQHLTEHCQSWSEWTCYADGGPPNSSCTPAEVTEGPGLQEYCCP